MRGKKWFTQESTREEGKKNKGWKRKPLDLNHKLTTEEKGRNDEFSK